MRQFPMSTPILLHTCCAPCGTASIERLIEEGYTPTLFFSNSNIAPYQEYLKRLEYFYRLAERFRLKALADSYRHQEWLSFIQGYEQEPEQGKRCRRCFEFNLKRSLRESHKQQIPQFTTSLTISPHKNSKKIFAIGSQLQGFLPLDFKKKDGFKRSIELSCTLDLYRQDYCGCEFSLGAKKKGHPESAQKIFVK